MDKLCILQCILWLLCFQFGKTKNLKCEHLGPLYNGKVRYRRGRNYDALVIFKCNKNADLVPNTRIGFCLENGQWSVPMPKCLVRCTIPSYPIQHGYIKYYKTRTKIWRRNVAHDSKVIIKCDSGYYLSLDGEPIEEFISECSRGSFYPSSFPICTIKPQSTTETIRDVDNADSSTLTSTLISTTLLQTQTQNDNDMITAHPETNAPSPLEDDIKTEIVTDTSILSSTVSSSTKASSGENWQEPQTTTETIRYVDNTDSSTLTSTLMPTTLPQTKPQNDSNMITAQPETNKPSPLEDGIKTEIVTETNISSSTVSSVTKASIEENLQETCLLTYDDEHINYVVQGEGHSLISGTEVEHGMTVVASCKGTGFQLQQNLQNNATFETTCVRGDWSHTGFPVCIEKPCPLSMRKASHFWTIDKDGIRTNLTEQTDVESGTKVFIDCDDGYKVTLTRGQNVPDNQTYSVCSKGQWDSIFKCKELPCTIPSYPIQHGYIKYYKKNTRIRSRNVAYDRKVIIKCDSGYYLSLNGEPIEEFISECSRGSFYPSSFPICTISKAEIGRVLRGKVMLGNTEIRESTLVSHGIIVHLTCNSVAELYSKVQQDYLIRQKISLESMNGTWSPAIPKCVLKRCDTHKYRLYKFTFMNGTQVPRKVDHNTYLKVYPVANHVFEDEDQDIPAIRQCKEGLITNLPYCAHDQCRLTIGEGAMYSNKLYSTLKYTRNQCIRSGVDIEIECRPGYRLFSADKKPLPPTTSKIYSSCLKSSWSRVISCEPEPCPLTYDDENIEYTVQGEGHSLISGTEVEHGMTVVASCKGTGFQMQQNLQNNATFETTCVRGYWSHTGFPVCIESKAEIGPVRRGNVRLGNTYIRESTLVSHGTIVHLTCSSESELYSNVQQDYLDRQKMSLKSVNGTWSPAIPECVFKRCDSNFYRLYRFTFMNGTRVPPKVDHNTDLKVYPVANHDFEDEDQDIPAIRQCKKGSIRYLPYCVPAFCSLTVDDCLLLKEGPAQFLYNEKRVSSGTEVIFEVNNADEYELYLDTYLAKFSATCNYGVWNKQRFPICREKRCRLRIGESAKYSDLNTEKKFTTNMYIESGTDVQIECKPGYRLVDADKKPLTLTTPESYSSCLKGSWSRVLSCEPERCRLRIDEGAKYSDLNTEKKFTTNMYIESGTDVQIECKPGYRLVDADKKPLTQTTPESYSSCLKGSWSRVLSCEPERCRLRIGEGAKYSDLNTENFFTTNMYIESGTDVQIECRPGYRLVDADKKPLTQTTPESYSSCLKGSWSRVLSCEPEPCPLSMKKASHFWTINKDGIRTNLTEQTDVESGTKVFIDCDVGYKVTLTRGQNVPDDQKYGVCSKGQWDPIFQCKESSMDSPKRRYYLHILTTLNQEYRIPKKFNEKLQVKLEGQQSKTSYQIASQIGEPFKEWNSYHAIFSFEAENIEKVDSVLIKRPLGTPMWRVKRVDLERRDTRMMYYSTVEKYIRDQEFVVDMNTRFNFLDSFTYRFGDVPVYHNNKNVYWMLQRKEYDRIKNAEDCQRICLEEKTFTCTTVVYYPFDWWCTTLPYFRRYYDRPYYKASLRYIGSVHLYTRNTISSTK